jgi:hypothetical protein
VEQACLDEVQQVLSFQRLFSDLHHHILHPGCFLVSQDAAVAWVVRALLAVLVL